MAAKDFMMLRRSNLDPSIPKISLQIEGKTKLTLTLPFHFISTLKWLEPMDINEKDKTIILYWNPYQALKEGKFVMLRISPSTAEHPNRSAEKVQLRCLQASEEDNSVNGQEFSEVAFNAQHQRMASFPEEFYEYMRVGETYQFFWPGGEISEWGYGRISERHGRKASELTNQSPLWLPPSNLIEFEVRQENEPWPDRDRWIRNRGIQAANAEEEKWRRLQKRLRGQVPGTIPSSQRDPDAPVLSLSMHAGPLLHLDGHYNVETKLTYEASEATNGKPITLYPMDLGQIEYGGNCCLIHYSERGPEWVQPDYVLPERYEREDKPIGEDDRFVTLFPGNCLEFDIELYPENHERGDFEPKHRYSYRFNGKVVDWWDWGTREDHRNTLAGKVPSSHSRRPDIIVPEVSVDFLVES